MTATEIAAWLTGRGWHTSVVDDDTVQAEHPDRRRPRMYLKEQTMFGHRWRIVDQKGTR